MKARIVPRKEIVLLYRHNRAENGEKLIDLLTQMKLEYRLVEEKDLNKTTGELAGYRAETQLQAQPEDVPQTPAMALGGLSGSKLDRLLTEMNRAQIDIPVKMVITQHNEGWKFADLISEVQKEHELFLSMERLQKTVELLKDTQDPAAKELIQKARAALNRMKGREENQPEAKELDGIGAEIAAYLQK